MPSDTSDLIRQHMAADPAFSRLTQGLSGKKATFNVVGPPDSLKSWLAWQLGAKTGRRPCLLVADELRQALSDAGLSEHGWVRLQQQRQHIRSQCNKAQRW